jgi:hypothetical protein
MFPAYRLDMHNTTPDAIALIAAAMTGRLHRDRHLASAAIGET